MEIVSIIIPVYNVEEYIAECIDSVILQSYQDLEILLINDGSTDRSGEICKNKSRDKRIVYLEKKNGGLSSARNYGLKYATGKYVYFLDSDDYLVDNAIELLVKEQKFSGADIVSSAFSMVEHDLSKVEKFEEVRFIAGDNSLFFLQNITNQACAKLYKRELFDGITYPIGMHYEDVSTTFKLYDRARKVSHTDSGLYCYRVRPGAITYCITNQDIEDLWKSYYSIKEYFTAPDDNQLFYEGTVLYTIYSRLIRSNCVKNEVRQHEEKIYQEWEGLKIKLKPFKRKSVMYPKLVMFKHRLTKYIIKIVDLKRKLI